MNAANAPMKPPARAGQWRARLAAGGLLLAGVVVVGLIASMPTPRTPVPPVERVPVNVKVQRVEPIPEIVDTFELTAVVQPYTVVRVSAEVPGRIEGYGARSAAARWQGGALPAGSKIAEGQPVTAGDPLVILNRDLLQARFDRASAQYDYDEQEYRRVLSLYERGNASSTEMRLARTRHDVSKADLDEAERSLARATIVAPISGILNGWPMDPGEYAAPGDAVAEIVDIEKVKVCADVPEREVGYLRVGQTAEVFSSPKDTAPLTGAITYINALADQATRTTRIEVTVQNRIPETVSPTASQPASSEYRLHSGQIVDVRLTRRTLHDVTMIPLASVIPLEDGKEVYVVIDGKAERRAVELGFIRGRSIQVTRGLGLGDLLIIDGHRLVSHGQPVNIVTSGEGQSKSGASRPVAAAPPAAGEERRIVQPAPRLSQQWAASGNALAPGTENVS
jgi:membrane fusion protein, multidrug efflux system